MATGGLVPSACTLVTCYRGSGPVTGCSAALWSGEGFGVPVLWAGFQAWVLPASCMGLLIMSGTILSRPLSPSPWQELSCLFSKGCVSFPRGSGFPSVCLSSFTPEIHPACASAVPSSQQSTTLSHLQTAKFQGQALPRPAGDGGTAACVGPCAWRHRLTWARGVGAASPACAPARRRQLLLSPSKSCSAAMRSRCLHKSKASRRIGKSNFPF